MGRDCIELTINPEETIAVITDFITSYVDASGTDGVVLGLSGGIDSALVATLCRRALGGDRVTCLFLPEASTPEEDRRHCHRFIETTGLPFHTIDITPMVEAHVAHLDRRPNKKVLANVKARVRMVQLFTYANMHNTLVCGTSNKSEILVGYFTKYGDGGVDIQPIGDVYKTQVFQLARHLKLPRPMIAKPPTAGLWLGQTDEGELRMKYETLDQILYGLECKWPVERIVADIGVSRREVERIRRLRAASQHKRRFPLVPKLGIRTPGLDWRSPVLEG